MINIKLLILICLFSLIQTILPQHNQSIQFSKSIQTLGNTRSFGVAISDVDLDGDKDIFISNYIGPSKLWINNGIGQFSQRTQPYINFEIHDVEIADLNGDSWPDIFIVNHNTPSRIYFNDGHGSFTQSLQLIGSANDYPQTIQLADIDSDGDFDALIYNFNAPNSIWLNNGSGEFTNSGIDYGGSDSNGLELADCNGDGNPDLFIAFRSQPNQLLLNDGLGNFTNTGQELGGDVDDTVIKDMDNDGDNDIISVGADIFIWKNQNNSGTFVFSHSLGEPALECEMLDADSDGYNELITSHPTHGNKLWINDGNGTFTSQGSIFGNARVISIGCSDIDGDATEDIIFGQEENTGGNSIYFNDSQIVTIGNKKNSSPFNFKLHQNYPNPFNPTTKIIYSIKESSFIELDIYDAAGRKIKSLLAEHKPVGIHSVLWNSNDESGYTVSSGVYFYKLTSNSKFQIRKMILLK